MSNKNKFKMNNIIKPCNPDIFQHGTPIVAIDGRPEPVERWVQSIALDSDSLVDWHYSGGIASVLHLGDTESRERVDKSITKLSKELDGTIMKRYAINEQGPYRMGVDSKPEGARAVFGNDPLFLVQE